MKSALRAARLFSALVLVATFSAAASVTLTGQVVAIADGDTLTLLTADNRQHRIRLDGIDAPERTQPYSQRSKQALDEMAKGRIATAQCSKIDKYNRSVCVVTIQGRDVGLAQIRAGLAWHFVSYSHEQTPENRIAYSAAEREARAAQSGLWQQSKLLPPWEFRATKKQSEATPQ